MRQLQIGNRIFLSGGYDMEPKWLGNNDGYYGTVIQFIPGQNDKPAAVVRLDSEIKVGDSSGEILVLELRFLGAAWSERETVHIELCDFVPESGRAPNRNMGKWVESHASYQLIT